MKYVNLNVSDICSPSNVRFDNCRSLREIYFVTPFHGNDARRCWS
jgi:hypothetical protein